MFKVSNLKIKLLDNVLCREWLTLYQSLNVDPDFSDSELIYWETYRDYFASELGSYLFDY